MKSHHLKRHRHRGEHAGDKSAPRRIMTTQQQIDGKDQHEMEGEPGKRLKNRRGEGHHKHGAQGLLPTGAQPNQRENAKDGNAEHRNLPHGIKAAKINQNHVDHVVSASQQMTVRQIVRRNNGGDGRPDIRRKQQQAHHETRAHTDADIEQARAWGVGLWPNHREVAQNQKEQDEADRFDQDLR